MNNKTTIIYLTGKPGIGKYTIAKELAKSHGFIVCDNQLINNLIFELLQYDVLELCRELYDLWFDSSILNGQEIAYSILHHNEHLTKHNEIILVRPSTLSDIDTMVSLSKTKRLSYEKAQAQFWHYAGKSGDNAQREWFEELIGNKEYLMFSAEDQHTGILGFVIGKLISAPEVYNPGGLTLMIDDFCVESENLWKTVGAQLIDAIKCTSKDQGAAQILVVCGSHDHPKRKFLMDHNLSIASEWFVGAIV